MSTFDKFVTENFAAEADRLIAARKRLQSAKSLPTGSVYANVMGAITCDQLTAGLHEATGVEVISPADTIFGDILVHFLDPAHRTICYRYNVLPICPDPEKGIFKFAALEKGAEASQEFKQILAGTPWAGMTPQIVALVPGIHMIVLWDTLSWLSSFDNFVFEADQNNLPRTSVAPYYPVERRLKLTFERSVTDYFARSLEREGLSIGSTREARRILRTLRVLLRTWRPIADLVAAEDPYCRFIDQLLALLGMATLKMTPLVPSLFALGVSLGDVSLGRSRPIHQDLETVRGTIDKLLAAVRGDDARTRKELANVTGNCQRIVVYGCPSMVIRSALVLQVLLHRPSSVHASPVVAADRHP